MILCPGVVIFKPGQIIKIKLDGWSNKEDYPYYKLTGAGAKIAPKQSYSKDW